MLVCLCALCVYCLLVAHEFDDVWLVLLQLCKCNIEFFLYILIHFLIRSAT